MKGGGADLGNGAVDTTRNSGRALPMGVDALYAGGRLAALRPSLRFVGCRPGYGALCDVLRSSQSASVGLRPGTSHHCMSRLSVAPS